MIIFTGTCVGQQIRILRPILKYGVTFPQAPLKWHVFVIDGIMLMPYPWALAVW